MTDLWHQGVLDTFQNKILFEWKSDFLFQASCLFSLAEKQMFSIFSFKQGLEKRADDNNCINLVASRLEVQLQVSPVPIVDVGRLVVEAEQGQPGKKNTLVYLPQNK